MPESIWIDDDDDDDDDDADDDDADDDDGDDGHELFDLGTNDSQLETTVLVVVSYQT